MRPYTRRVGNKGVWDMSLSSKVIVTLRNMRRTHKGHIGELAESIESQGQLAPILVNRRLKGGKVVYELIGGFHRLMACKLLGLSVWCTVFDALPPEEAMARQLAENIHKDPDTTEWAGAFYESYLYYREEGIGDGTIADYAKRSGFSSARIRNAIRFMQDLDERVVGMAHNNVISYGVAVELARIQDTDIQYDWAKRAIVHDWVPIVARAKVSSFMKGDDGSTLGGLFGEQPYIDYDEIRSTIDPRLERTAMADTAWAERIFWLIENGHFPKCIIGSRRLEQFTAMSRLSDRARDVYEGV